MTPHEGAGMLEHDVGDAEPGRWPLAAIDSSTGASGSAGTGAARLRAFDHLIREVGQTDAATPRGTCAPLRPARASVTISPWSSTIAAIADAAHEVGRVA